MACIKEAASVPQNQKCVTGSCWNDTKEADQVDVHGVGPPEMVLEYWGIECSIETTTIWRNLYFVLGEERRVICLDGIWRIWSVLKRGKGYFGISRQLIQNNYLVDIGYQVDISLY